MSRKFNWRTLERRWQRKWSLSRIHEAEPVRGKTKYFVTAAFPYPNSPQHIGHGRTYTLADVNARFHRMRGYNTLFPMAFHLTGTPIFAMCKRLQAHDPEIIRTFTHIYGIPKSKLEYLKEPLNMARYFRDEIRKGMVEIGFSIDWRREFTTVDTLYSRFIEWHFRKLRALGLITRGTHPVGWCPNDNGPVGYHDTQGEVEPEIGESFLVKFERDGVVYPTATLRPETVFGVTNLWLNPTANYVRAEVDGETWVISKDTVEKLRHQNRAVKVLREVDPKDSFWKTVENPATKSPVPILPGEFVDPSNGTGVVMSVPAHAPYDLQALNDLKGKESGSDRAAQVDSVKPFPIIRLEGSSDLPAEDIIKEFHVADQKDPHLEDATKELYSREFHRGVMMENTGTYSGLSVGQAREMVVQEFTRNGKIAKLYEIKNRPVFCRCGWECVVHILSNQWFINYGDHEWKKLAHDCLASIALLPEDSIGQFNYTIDWLKERACARKVGLGTPLPWDKEWIIESLSDSVIYMAYYVLAKFVSKKWMAFKKLEKLSPEIVDGFFGYIFLGEGNPDTVTRSTGLPRRILDAIRGEFLYFYPVDMRHSGKDLIPNHFTFYIFHHSVLFPRERWPKGIVANGFVMMEGTKMSKSLENIIPLRQGIAKYGADPIRIGVMATAELGQDTDFSETLVTSIQEKLVSLMNQTRKLGHKRKGAMSSPSSLDKWMLSRLNDAVKEATGSMEKLRVREVINRILYQLDNELSWYQRRSAVKSSKTDNRTSVLRKVFEARSKMLAPVAPHVAEQMWHALGNKGLASMVNWPDFDAGLEDPVAEQGEWLIKELLSDTGEIVKATGMKPGKVVYYAAPSWKWRIYMSSLESASTAKISQGVFLSKVMDDAEMRKLGKEAADYATKVVQQVRETPEGLRQSRLKAGRLSEKEILRQAREFLSKELKAEVDVWEAKEAGAYDPKGRARFAEPYRPAILVE